LASLLRDSDTLVIENLLLSDLSDLSVFSDFSDLDQLDNLAEDVSLIALCENWWCEPGDVFSPPLGDKCEFCGEMSASLGDDGESSEHFDDKLGLVGENADFGDASEK
jgi:hypothetical protein